MRTRTRRSSKLEKDNYILNSTLSAVRRSRAVMHERVKESRALAEEHTQMLVQKVWEEKI